MRRVMLNCREATLLVEKEEDKGLKLKEKIQLVMHTGMCNACTNYKKQSHLIQQWLDRWLMSENYPAREQQQILKDKILQKIEKE